ncbi:MAG TPA: glycosyltransferase [Candidatus Eisenbacteria bacterium]|nr:glycosyltransferase [Candidatus Eisenbacteria bacterium]
MTAPALSIVMPAYNSAGYIDRNVGVVLDFFRDAGLDGEVIVADDGSVDGTPDAVRAAANVHVLRLRHAGKGSALRAGMTEARGEVRGFTDADLPYGIDAIPLALRYIRERRYHAVIGDRTLPGSSYPKTGLLRGALSGLASFVFRTLVTGGIYDTQCGFKFFRGDVAGEVFRIARIDGFAIDVEVIYLLLKYRLDLKRIPVQFKRNAPSSVRVIRDSVGSVRDIGSIRLNLALGRYRSPKLLGLLQAELAADMVAAGPPVVGSTVEGPP